MCIVQTRMKLSWRQIGWVVGVAAVVSCALLLLGKGPGPIGVTMLGWTLSDGLVETNQYAMIQITNRTVHAQAVGLRVESLNANGSWAGVPEKLVLPPGVANVMFVLPGSSSTNVRVKWFPVWGKSWRVGGEHDRVVGPQEGRFIQWAARLRLPYLFMRGGQISLQEIGAPNEMVRRVGDSDPVQETNQRPEAAGSYR